MVIDLSVGKRAGRVHVCINPEIVEREGEMTEEEGCLSIPDFVETVTRPERVEAALPRPQRRRSARCGAKG